MRRKSFSPTEVIYTHDFKQFVKQFHLPTQKARAQYDEIYNILRDTKKNKNYLQIKSSEYKISNQKQANIIKETQKSVKTLKDKVVIKRKVLNDYLSVVNKRGEILEKIKENVQELKEKSDKNVVIFSKWYNKECLDELRQLFTEIGPMYQCQLGAIEINTQKMMRVVSKAQKRVEKREFEEQERKRKKKEQEQEEKEKRRRENKFWYILEKEEEEEALKANHQDQEARIQKIKGYLLSSQDVEAGKRDVQKMAQIQLYGSDMQKKEIFEKGMKQMIKKNKKEQMLKEQKKEEKKNQEKKNNKEAIISQKIGNQNEIFDQKVDQNNSLQIEVMDSQRQNEQVKMKPQFYSPKYGQGQNFGKFTNQQQNMSQSNFINKNYENSQFSQYKQYQQQLLQQQQYQQQQINQNQNNSLAYNSMDGSTLQSSRMNINMYKSMNGDISNTLQNDSIISPPSYQPQNGDFFRNKIKKRTMPTLPTSTYQDQLNCENFDNNDPLQPSPRTKQNPSYNYKQKMQEQLINDSQKNQNQQQQQLEEEKLQQIDNSIIQNSEQVQNQENSMILKEIKRKNRTMSTIITKPTILLNQQFQSTLNSPLNYHTQSNFSKNAGMKYHINQYYSNNDIQHLEDSHFMEQKSNHQHFNSIQIEKASFLSTSPNAYNKRVLMTSHLSPINSLQASYIQTPQPFQIDSKKQKQRVILGDDKIEVEGYNGQKITQSFRRESFVNNNVDDNENQNIQKGNKRKSNLQNLKNLFEPLNENFHNVKHLHDIRQSIDQIPSINMIQPFQMPQRNSVLSSLDNTRNNSINDIKQKQSIMGQSFQKNKNVHFNQQQKNRSNEVLEEEEDEDQEENKNTKEDIFKYNKLTKVYINKFYKNKLLGQQNDVAPIYTQYQLDEIEKLKKKRTSKFTNAKSRLFDFRSPKIIESQMCRENQQIVEQHGAQILNLYSNVQRQCGKQLQSTKQSLKSINQSKKSTKKNFQNVKKTYSKNFGNKDIVFWKMENEKFNKIQEDYWKKYNQKQQELQRLEKQKKLQIYSGEDDMIKQQKAQELKKKQQQQKQLQEVRKKQLEYVRQKAQKQIKYYDHEKSQNISLEAQQEEMDNEQQEQIDLIQENINQSILQSQNSQQQQELNYQKAQLQTLKEQKLFKDFDSQGQFTQEAKDFIIRSKKHDIRRQKMEQKDKEFEKQKPKPIY